MYGDPFENSCHFCCERNEGSSYGQKCFLGCRQNVCQISCLYPKAQFTQKWHIPAILFAKLNSRKDGPEKVQNQGRNERTQEDYPTSVMYFLQI